RLLEAAAAVFTVSGVDTPIREIAAEAGVGVGTVYRHFPNRTELVVAVYGRQVEACAEMLEAAERSGQITPGVEAYDLMRGIGNLCIGHESDTRYDPRRMVGLLPRGLREPGGRFFAPVLCPALSVVAGRKRLPGGSHGDQANPIAAELGHVVDVGGQHDHRPVLTKRDLGHGRVD